MITFSSVAFSRKQETILQTLTKNQGILKMKHLAKRSG